MTLATSYKSSHAVFVFLWLAYFTYQNVFKVYSCWSKHPQSPILVVGKKKGSHSHLLFLCVCVPVLVAQSCPALCNPVDCSSPGSSVLGIVLSVTPWTVCCPPSPWDFPGKNTGVGCHALLQGIFPTQGSNPGLLHCRQILYHLNYQGSPSSFYIYIVFHINFFQRDFRKLAWGIIWVPLYEKPKGTNSGDGGLSIQ